MTAREIELLQCALDKIGAGLDEICDLVCEIETKAAREAKPTKTKTKKAK